MSDTKSGGNNSRGQSSNKGPGGNWPSTTGNPSGGGRGNSQSKSSNSNAKGK